MNLGVEHRVRSALHGHGEVRGLRTATLLSKISSRAEQ